MDQRLSCGRNRSPAERVKPLPPRLGEPFCKSLKGGVGILNKDRKDYYYHCCPEKLTVCSLETVQYCSRSMTRKVEKN